MCRKSASLEPLSWRRRAIDTDRNGRSCLAERKLHCYIWAVPDTSSANQTAHQRIQGVNCSQLLTIDKGGVVSRKLSRDDSSGALDWPSITTPLGFDEIDCMKNPGLISCRFRWRKYCGSFLRDPGSTRGIASETSRIELHRGFVSSSLFPSFFPSHPKQLPLRHRGGVASEIMG